jgi:hypothetical protein
MRELPPPSVIRMFGTRGFGATYGHFRGIYDSNGRVVRLFEPGERTPLRWRRLFWWRYRRKGLSVPTVEDARRNPYRPDMKHVRRGRTAFR